MAQVSGAGLDTLSAKLSGAVLTDKDAAYDTARSVWNGAIDRRPAVIVRCATAQDVAAAIRFARDNGLEISVRGGGHNYAGHAVSDGGLMIDLSTMTAVSIDADARRAVCGGGTTWEMLDGAAQQHGLAVPGGFISHTGIAGLTLGGGIGWLTKLAGLSCDNLVRAEVVTADSHIVTASADENPDLFWALRGGGGNFGVVTTFEYRVHDVGPMANLGLFFWGLETGSEALRFAREYVKSLPRTVTGFIGVCLSAPPAPFVPEQYQGKPGHALAITGFGTDEEHAAAIAPVRATTPAPLFELVTPIPYVALQQMFNESAPWGTYGYERALYLDDISDGAIDVIATHAPRKSSPLSFAPTFGLTGAFLDVGDEDTAFGGGRAPGYVFNIAAGAPTPELYEADRQWVRDFWDGLRPHARGAGGYVNFLADADEDRVRASYGPERYARLARIKAEYDADNAFHLNVNIKPA